MTKELIVTVGLPRSGKSTWALSLGYPIVCRDSIRLALHGKAFLPESENMVTVLEDIMVKSLFQSGHSTVVVDATHVTQEGRDRWIDMFKYQRDVIVTFQAFTTGVEVCKQRAVDTDQEYLLPVIDNMAAVFDFCELKEG